MGLFNFTEEGRPTWFMRQAGRYHAHYRNLRAQHGFMDLCKNPELAVEVTLGPLAEFKFDAAILFSDLLFPLEDIGMGLDYLDGPPRLSFNVKTTTDLDKLGPTQKEFYSFQNHALSKLKTAIPENTDLLGFVGAPWTLYTYAVSGSHAGSLVDAKAGLANGLFEKFWEKLSPSLWAQLEAQALAGPDVICFFDTALGELAHEDIERWVLPVLSDLMQKFKKSYPDIKILYYSKMTHFKTLKLFKKLPLDILGVDWRHDILKVLKEFSDHCMVQGNFDPCWLHFPEKEFQEKADTFLGQVPKNSELYKRWIPSLGHGVLPKTPEEHVKALVEMIHNGGR